jgi:hypothetical protein
MANALKKALNAVLGGVNSAKEIKSLNDLSEFSKGANDLLEIKDKSYTEVIREAIGIDIPLPSQEEAFEFYQKFEGKFERITVEEQRNDGSIVKVQKREYRIKEKPTSPLAYLDPKKWTKKQYLKYQTDYQKFQASDPYKKLSQKAFESKAKAIKRVKKEIYDEKKRFNVLLELYEEFQSDKAENLKEDVPQDLKPKGIQSFPQLINALLKVTVKTFFTSLASTYKQFGLDIADQKEAELKEKLGINDLSQASPEEIKAKFCPIDIKPLIQKRDNMVNTLNKTQERLNNLKKPIEGTGLVIDFAQRTSTTIKLTNFILNNVILILPPGIIKNTINGTLSPLIKKLDTIRETILFTNEGQARIPKFQGAISNVNIPLNQFSRLITQIVFQLSELDELIALCAPDRVSELTSLSPEVLATVAIQLSADLETNNASTYKGFRLEIETQKYTDTVNQNRAVGKNSSGIVLISTPFSFASDPNVLIRELQFRIDSENLEAY